MQVRDMWAPGMGQAGPRNKIKGVKVKELKIKELKEVK